MPGDSGPLQAPKPLTGTPLFMSDTEDGNDRGGIDERDGTREPPGLAFATPEIVINIINIANNFNIFLISLFPYSYEFNCTS